MTHLLIKLYLRELMNTELESNYSGYASLSDDDSKPDTSSKLI